MDSWEFLHERLKTNFKQRPPDGLVVDRLSINNFPRFQGSHHLTSICVACFRRDVTPLRLSALTSRQISFFFFLQSVSQQLTVLPTHTQTHMHHNVVFIEVLAAAATVGRLSRRLWL